MAGMVTKTFPREVVDVLGPTYFYRLNESGWGTCTVKIRRRILKYFLGCPFWSSTEVATLRDDKAWTTNNKLAAVLVDGGINVMLM